MEIKQVYRNADLVGRRTVFNIAGNKYAADSESELACRIRVFVLHLLTHSEYDQGTWKPMSTYNHRTSTRKPMENFWGVLYRYVIRNG